MRNFIENTFALIGLVVVVIAAPLFILTLDRVDPTPKCMATVQQCGYGMRCGTVECYRGRR